MASKHHKLAKVFPCFHDSGEQLSPSDEKQPLSSLPDSECPHSKKQMTTKQQAEAYIPTWNRLDVPHPPATGRRKAASVSNGCSDADSSGRTPHKRSRSAGENMLFFGDGTPPSRRTYAPVPTTDVASTTTPRRSGNGAVAGRDASGYLSNGLTNSSIMHGTHSALTYGGSLQFNYAQTQSYGAGTGT